MRSSGGRGGLRLDVDVLGMDEEEQFAVLAEAAGRGGPLPRPRAALETMPGGWRVRYVIFAKSLTGGRWPI